MNYKHKSLSEGRWCEFTFFEQMANIGSEVERAILWRDKNKEYSLKAIERALELIEFTIKDPKNKKKLREILRLKEVLIDYFYFDNKFKSSDELWRKYFYPFMYRIQIKK